MYSEFVQTADSCRFLEYPRTFLAAPPLDKGNKDSGNEIDFALTTLTHLACAAHARADIKGNKPTSGLRG